jgi:hypothetical protein
MEYCHAGFHLKLDTLYLMNGARVIDGGRNKNEKRNSITSNFEQ